MTADEVIAVRKLWSQFNYAPLLPTATILATRDWLAYVMAMAAAMPPTEQVTMPTEEEVAWAWPDGCTIVVADRFEMSHVIISRSQERGGSREIEPTPEPQKVAGLAICPRVKAETKIAGSGKDVSVRDPEGNTVDVMARHVLWIGDDPSDIVTGHWLPGGMLHRQGELGDLSQSSKFLLSVLTALGHRLTRISEPTGSRAERRRAQRDLPGLRVLELASGASVTRAKGDSNVEWTRRWMVRGHWHTVAHGPKRSLRRLQWYDPYVKGPEDKPLDVRLTIWKATA